MHVRIIYVIDVGTGESPLSGFSFGKFASKMAAETQPPLPSPNFHLLPTLMHVMYFILIDYLVNCLKVSNYHKRLIFQTLSPISFITQEHMGILGVSLA